MSWLYVAREDVRAFRAGLAADCFTPLTHQVSFPWDDGVEAAVAAVVGTMYVFVDSPTDGFLADPSLRTPILFKLVAYLSRTGRVQPTRIRDTIQDAAMVASVLSEQPHLIEDPVGFKGLLARYRQSLAESKRVPKAVKPGRPAKPHHLPPRKVLWTSVCGAYALSELVDPWHLVEEMDALGHCVGRPYDNKWTGYDSDLRVLPYWRQIATGRSRVFSLGEGGAPLCTLHVELKPATLMECEGRRGGGRLKDHVWFPALVDAVAHLRTMFGELRFDDTLGLSAPDVVAYCDPDTRVRSLPRSLAERRATLA